MKMVSEIKVALGLGVYELAVIGLMGAWMWNDGRHQREIADYVQEHLDSSAVDKREVKSERSDLRRSMLPTGVTYSTAGHGRKTVSPKWVGTSSDPNGWLVDYGNPDGDEDFDTMLAYTNSTGEVVGIQVEKGLEGKFAYPTLSETAVDPFHLVSLIHGQFLPKDYADIDGDGLLESIVYIGVGKDRQPHQVQIIDGVTEFTNVGDLLYFKDKAA